MSMGKPDVLISEETLLGMRLILLAIYRLASFAVHGSACIPAFNAEILHNSVNPLVLIVLSRTFLSCAEHSEILDRFRAIFVEKFKDNAPSGLFFLCLIIKTYLEIVETLDVFGVELWERLVNYSVFLLFNFALLFVINSISNKTRYF
jgi:hypothetical protein